tara:strand:+ start:421 stop:810 length:390 start_codon:yes stop_codon:yes gene_type:complete
MGMQRGACMQRWTDRTSHPHAEVNGTGHAEVNGTGHAEVDGQDMQRGTDRTCRGGQACRGERGEDMQRGRGGQACRGQRNWTCRGEGGGELDMQRRAEGGMQRWTDITVEGGMQRWGSGWGSGRGLVLG